MGRHWQRYPLCPASRHRPREGLCPLSANRSCVSFVGRQAFHQPRAAPKLKWPIFETCPDNCGFVRVAQKRAGALKMPVRSHEEHAIVCQRQGVTLVLATSQATRLQRPLANEHVEEGRRQSPAIRIAAIVPTAVSICGANNAPVARTIVGGSIVTRRAPFGDIAGLARYERGAN
jgi:hypothetical protein